MQKVYAKHKMWTKFDKPPYIDRDARLVIFQKFVRLSCGRREMHSPIAWLAVCLVAVTTVRVRAMAADWDEMMWGSIDGAIENMLDAYPQPQCETRFPKDPNAAYLCALGGAMEEAIRDTIEYTRDAKPECAMLNQDFGAVCAVGVILQNQIIQEAPRSPWGTMMCTAAPHICALGEILREFPILRDLREIIRDAQQCAARFPKESEAGYVCTVGNTLWKIPIIRDQIIRAVPQCTVLYPHPEDSEAAYICALGELWRGALGALWRGGVSYSVLRNILREAPLCTAWYPKDSDEADSKDLARWRCALMEIIDLQDSP